MGLFDFLKPKKEKKFSTQKEEAKPVAPRVKKDWGVCIPDHAKSKDEKKKQPKHELSPFEKLQKEHEKEIVHTLKDIEEQEPEEPYDFEPELGIQGIESKEEQPKRKTLKDLPSGRTDDIDDNSVEELDELDAASKKMDDGYVPRFSSTARQKLGLEQKAEPVRHTLATFEVRGLYPGAESMISGTVTSGRITKRMTAQNGKATIRITDIKKGAVSVQELNDGDNGTIFTRGIVSNLRNGDELEFS